VSQTKSTLDFGTLRGRPVLVVNVASACGLTAQNYAELSTLYEPLKAKTQLEVLAFPCDQFMHQESGACWGRARRGEAVASLESGIATD
jgi:glutathione peroxidase-family protein